MSHFRKAFTIERQAPGTFVNGKPVPGAITNMTIMATVQPLSGDEILLMPEGERKSQYVTIFTDTLLNAPSTSPVGFYADTILAFGQKYKVLVVEPWQSDVINHYKCKAIKI